jgi:hypothetical protein
MLRSFGSGQARLSIERNITRDFSCPVHPSKDKRGLSLNGLSGMKRIAGGETRYVLLSSCPKNFPSTISLCSSFLGV